MTGKRKYRVLTDSGCDLPDGWEEKYGVDIMNFEVMLDDVIYNERKDITTKEFYSLMNNSSSLPTTNQIVAPRFEEKFLEYQAEGVKDVLTVLINSRGSQTYANAVFAKKSLEEKGELSGMDIRIIDSRTYSIGYGYPLIEAVKKMDAGQSLEQAAAYLEDWFCSAEVYILPLNLKYMKKSGRITAAAAFLGELMGLKPVISLIDGESVVLGKVRGEKAVIDEAVKIVKSKIIPQTPWLALSGEEAGFFGDMVRSFQKELGSPPAMESFVGCVVSCNTGPKVAAVIIKGENRGPMNNE